MDNGSPLEENWVNRAGSEDFRNLVNYTDAYRPLASRYAVGEHSNFLMAPMQLTALQQGQCLGAGTDPNLLCGPVERRGAHVEETRRKHPRNKSPSPGRFATAHWHRRRTN